MADEGQMKTLTFDGEDYQDDFDSESYLDQFYPGCDPENLEHGFAVTMMRLLHQLFDGGKYSGKTLLEICSGPTLYSVMSASKYFSNIYLCDYAAPNREALRKWLSNDPKAHDWTPFFNFVASLEGNSADKISERLRDAIKDIFHCDLHNVLPLGKEQETITPVDAIISPWTLEVVVKEDEKLSDYYKKFYDMLKDGGFFLTMAIGKMSYYYQAGKRYWGRGFPREMVKESLAEAGFTDIVIVEVPVAETDGINKYGDATQFCMYHAIKRV